MNVPVAGIQVNGENFLAVVKLVSENFVPVAGGCDHIEPEFVGSDRGLDLKSGRVLTGPCSPGQDRRMPWLFGRGRACWKTG